MIAFSLLTCDCRVTRSNLLERLIWIGEKEKKQKKTSLTTQDLRFTLKCGLIEYLGSSMNATLLRLLCYRFATFYGRFLKLDFRVLVTWCSIKSIERHDIQNYMNLEHDKCHKIKGKFHVSKVILLWLNPFHWECWLNWIAIWTREYDSLRWLISICDQ